MPMLYVAQIGGNFVEIATEPKDIIYLVCNVKNIFEKGLLFYFTDGHATDMLTRYYDKTKIEDLVGIIDWNAVKSYFWAGNENLDIKRKKQAEFLVKDDLSPDLITGFGCYDDKARNKLIMMGVDSKKIKVIPKAYF